MTTAPLTTGKLGMADGSSTGECGVGQVGVGKVHAAQVRVDRTTRALVG